MIFRKIAFILLAGLLAGGLWAQSSWEGARITLLTCSPGQALYSSFGHTALRIQDPSRGLDQIYNYGTFDFNTPHFYWKFMRGKLLYNLSIQSFSSFMSEYREEGRAVYEEEVLLDGAEKEAVARFLAENYRTENRYYLYDFFFDNCSSRIRDVFEAVLKDRLTYVFPKTGETITYRQAINPYIQAWPWLDLGIDLLLGTPTDRVADERGMMFLPDFLSENLAYARIDGERNLLGPRVYLLDRQFDPPQRARPYPAILFWALLPVFLLLWRFSPRLIRTADLFFWTLFGLVGCLVAFMTWGTDHQATQHNWNILWLNPVQLAVAIGLMINRKARWLKVFGWIQLLVAVGILISWKWLPQEIPAACFPLVLLLGIQSWRLAKVYVPLISPK
ncbi:MAG: DUF4105 domain-containing protein [Lewinellaceae bacterium]|nr:DUF4105 domain-containing protein [Lewinellaceae bacterium]